MFERINNLGIKAKLVIIFIVIKIVPLLIISFMAIKGVQELETYFLKDTDTVLEKAKNVVNDTAKVAIKDSIKALDQKSQTSLERLTVEVANDIAQFLYERNSDLLFLAQSDLSHKTFRLFMDSKSKQAMVHEEYIYDDDTGTWKSRQEKQGAQLDSMTADLKDNETEFHHFRPPEFQTKPVPIYKEITFFDLNGKEKIKVSSINKQLKDIRYPANTYINSERYFVEATKLKRGEIFVSDVIGAYVPSRIIGTYNKTKVEQLVLPFAPEIEGYAGKENPKGKRFQGIIRFVTPVYRGNKKIGYLTLALDHIHIMEYTDYIVPTEENISNISDGSDGNYAFMWDYEGRCISHVRDYFIIGFDPKTGERVPGWISEDLAKRWKTSGIKKLNAFLKTVKRFDHQSLEKRGWDRQVLEGKVGLDCRYLNHAPQCQGWFQLTEDGGYGSFIIFWSDVWKLTTAATIPYYTGQYGKSKRGFGFVTIGANVEEFHRAADKTRQTVDVILEKQEKSVENLIGQNKKRMLDHNKALINELTVTTLLMMVIVIMIAVWLSDSITKRLMSLIKGVREFSLNRMFYRIKVKSQDEVGQLSQAFNEMAQRIYDYQFNLEGLIEERTKKLNQINEQLKKEIIDHRETEKVLIQTKQQAEKANQSKSDFLAAMSHELRTPMHGILGFAKLGMSKTQWIKNEKMFLFFSEIHASGLRLLSLLNNLLDLSKLEAGKVEFHFTKGYLSNLVQIVLNEQAIIFKEKNIRVEFKEPTFPDSVILDSEKIIQVISNLLSNAVKFSKPNNTIVLNIDEKKGQLLFSIADKGIGIPEKELEFIFNKFVQSSKSKTGAGGTGLGLSISKEIIEGHNGNIWAENNSDGGATITFSLPRSVEKTKVE